MYKDLGDAVYQRWRGARAGARLQQFRMEVDESERNTIELAMSILEQLERHAETSTSSYASMISAGAGKMANEWIDSGKYDTADFKRAFMHHILESPYSDEELAFGRIVGELTAEDDGEDAAEAARGAENMLREYLGLELTVAELEEVKEKAVEEVVETIKEEENAVDDAVEDAQEEGDEEAQDDEEAAAEVENEAPPPDDDDDTQNPPTDEAENLAEGARDGLLTGD